MTPTVIADSDGDESDTGSATELPEVVAVEKSASTTHPSGSTDPTFFRSVFKEQSDAAKEHAVRHHQTEEAEDEIMDPSSFDNGFQQTRGTVHDKSLWDVPSSPEFEQPSRRAKKTDGSSNTRTKITRGLRRRLDDIGYVSQEDEPTGTVTTQSRKKRRVERDAPLDDLVSTAPIDSDPAFMVAPTMLTTSQREEYVSVKAGASSPAAKPLEQRCINVMSSGTATNLNTPRTTVAPSYDAAPDIKSSKSDRLKQVRGLRNSLPDEAVVSTSAPESNLSTKKEKSSSMAKSHRVINASDDESGLGEHDQPPETTKDDGSDFEETANPVEKKKQRGRPKKENTATPKKKVAETKAKKKRGRPRKSDAAVKLDENGDVQETAQVPPDPAPAESDMKQHTDTKTEEAEQTIVSPVKEKSITAANAVLDKTPQTPTSDMKDGADVNSSKKPSSKALSAPSGDSGRPLYRVGLSRNMRIAPLLKVIRK